MAGLRTTSGVVFVIGGRALHVPGKILLWRNLAGLIVVQPCRNWAGRPGLRGVWGLRRMCVQM